MSQITKWLIRLYPSAWRGRYGDELEGLVEDSNAGWQDAFDVLKGALSMQSVRWPVIVSGCAALGALAGFAASFLLPQVYVSRASVAIKSRTGVVPAEAVAATFQSAMSRTSLTEVIRAQDLYSHDLANSPLEDVVDRMRRDISITALPPTPGAEVSFTYEDRRKAQETTWLLVASIINANARNVRDAGGSPRFTLEVTKPPGLPTRPVNLYFFKGSLVGLTAGLLLGSIIARVRRHHAVA